MAVSRVNDFRVMAGGHELKRLVRVNYARQWADKNLKGVDVVTVVPFTPEGPAGWEWRREGGTWRCVYPDGGEVAGRVVTIPINLTRDDAAVLHTTLRRLVDHAAAKGNIRLAGTYARIADGVGEALAR